MQIRRKRDVRELLSYVSQNYKTLILELPSARAHDPLCTGKKRRPTSAARYRHFVHEECVKLLISPRKRRGLHASGSVVPSKRRAAARVEERGRVATQRETLDKSAMVHPRLPARDGKDGGREAPRMDRGEMQELDGTRERQERTR